MSEPESPEDKTMHSVTRRRRETLHAIVYFVAVLIAWTGLGLVLLDADVFGGFTGLWPWGVGLALFGFSLACFVAEKEHWWHAGFAKNKRS